MKLNAAPVSVSLAVPLSALRAPRAALCCTTLALVHTPDRATTRQFSDAGTGVWSFFKVQRAAPPLSDASSVEAVEEDKSK
jgi:hypothetical protein